jgi:protein involved in polysaccharide export with SLBB domain
MMRSASLAVLFLLAPLAGTLAAQSFVQPDTQVVELAREQQMPLAPPLTEASAPLTPTAVQAAARKGYSYTKDGLPIFGSQLFQGDFKDVSFNGFNPDYQIGIGDAIHLTTWGALETSLELKVDAQGNIFIPRIGPIMVLGVRNADLNKLINDRIRQTYKENVDTYANLRSTQTVKVFTSGSVMKPGLYQGFASDSVLYFLDRAGGIDPERGSYLNISILRAGKPVASTSLYDFLEKGILPITQFRDGDVILVGPRGNTITIQGEVNNSGRFEFTGAQAQLDHLLTLAAPKAGATSLSVRRAQGGYSQALTFPIAEAAQYQLQPGDLVEVSSHNVPKTILVTIAGEHEGPQNIVLPYGAVLAQGLDKIVPSSRSDMASLQVFRKSVADRQKALLNQSLDNLERNVLNAQSSSLEEAKLRQTESEMIFAFIKRAREVHPKGQVLLESVVKADQLRLEDGDILYIPIKSSLVTVYGEVKFPNTQTYRDHDRVSKYIERAGGFTTTANEKELIIIRPNGAIDSIGKGHGVAVEPGDEIIVLPKPDKKGFLFAKDISTIIYQLAISARVVIGL